MKKCSGCYREAWDTGCKILELTLRHRVAHDKVRTSRQSIDTSCIHFSLIDKRFTAAVCWIMSNDCIIMFITSTGLLVRNVVMLASLLSSLFIDNSDTNQSTSVQLGVPHCHDSAFRKTHLLTSLSLKMLGTKSMESSKMISESLMLEGISWDHLVQPRDSSSVSYSMLSKIMCSQLLRILIHGDSTICIGDLFHCLTNLTLKKKGSLLLRWHFVCFNLVQLPLNLSLGYHWKEPVSLLCPPTRFRTLVRIPWAISSKLNSPALSASPDIKHAPESLNHVCGPSLQDSLQ